MDHSLNYIDIYSLKNYKLYSQLKGEKRSDQENKGEKGISRGKKSAGEFQSLSSKCSETKRSTQ